MEKRPDDWVENLHYEGRKAVLEALNHGRPIDRIFLKKEADGTLHGTLRLIASKAKEAGVVATAVDKAKLDSMAQSGNHQGVIAVCPAKAYVEISDILGIARERNEPPFVLVLDGITDPHNLGAIIRTADAAGVHGVIIPKRRAVGLTGTVAKTSAGAIEHMLIARVTNVTDTIKKLQSLGLWVTCADMDGDDMYAADLTGPMALVLGAEGAGVSRLVAQASDFRVKIPMLGKIASLNVSVAAGVLVYEVVRRRLLSDKKS
jgi:23S rRNA (guanosine2251-2'-O)-methyltransferase